MKKIITILLGCSSFLLGFAQLSFAAWSYFIAEPKLKIFYEDRSTNYSPWLVPYFILIGVAIINFIFSYKLFSDSTEKYLRLGAGLFLLVSFFIFFLIGFGKFSNVAMSVYL